MSACSIGKGIVWPDPERAAIIVANHTSLLDGPALALLTPRPILFGVDPAYSRHPFWRPLMLMYAGMVGTACEVVPMTPGSPIGLRSLACRLEVGGWVCLFPEGGISTGRRYPGVDWLVKRVDVSVCRLRISAAGIGKLRWPYRVETTDV
jgi:1-acyl-sn-glycerol-3-phosphate acyltransferase